MTEIVCVFRCERCERRAEVSAEHLALKGPPECSEYVPGSRQRFPDGSWIHIGEGYTPHGPMADTGERLKRNPFQKFKDERDNVQAERVKDHLETGSMFEALPQSREIDEPRGVTDAKR